MWVNDVEKIWVGDTEVTTVWQGDTIVWEPPVTAPVFTGIIENVDITVGDGNVTREAADALENPDASGVYTITVDGVANTDVATINSSTGSITILDDLDGEYAIIVIYTADTGTAEYGFTATINVASMPIFSQPSYVSLLIPADDPRDIAATAEISGSGTTLTPQTAYLDVTPALITSPANWHTAEFRDIPVTSGNRYVFSLHLKQGTSPTTRIKIRAGDTGSETLFIYTWADNSYTRNNAFVLGTETFRDTAGPDGTRLIEIEADSLLTDTNVFLGVGANSATSQTVIVYTMAVSEVAPLAPVTTANVYVATTGNDSTGDGTSGTPWATIDKAMREIAPNTVINLAAGTYTEHLRFRKSTYPVLATTTATDPVIIRGTRASGALDAAWNTIITRNGSTTGGVNQSTIEFPDGPGGIFFEDLHIIGTALNNGGTVNDQSPIKLNASNNISGGDYTVYCRDIQIRRCRITGIGEDVMKAVRTIGLVFEGNLIENFTATSAESILDILMAENTTVRFNTCASTAKADDFCTFKGGTRGFNRILNNDVQMEQAVVGRPVIYAGNASRSFSNDHALTDFAETECRDVEIRNNWFRPTVRSSQGVRAAGGIDITIDANYFGGTILGSQCVVLQQSKSNPTGREIFAAEYNALNATQKNAVILSGGRYWVAHPNHGNHVTDNLFSGASGSFGITSFNHPYDNANPQTASIVSPATRGYLASGNTTSNGATPPFSVGYTNLP